MYESLPRQNLIQPHNVLERVNVLTAGKKEDYTGEKIVAKDNAEIVSRGGGLAVKASLLERDEGTSARSGVRRIYRAELDPNASKPKASVTESELVYEGDESALRGEGTQTTELPGGIKLVSRARELDPSEAAAITGEAIDTINGTNNNVVPMQQPPASTAGGDHIAA